jgi:hypothetical protein
MHLIKRIFLVNGLVILKLTQPLIPADYPNSLNFYGTEGVLNQQFTVYKCYLLSYWGLLYGTDFNSVNLFCDVIISLVRKICYTQY